MFISHASLGRPVVEQNILPLLRTLGIRYWYSSENIPSSSDWEKVILRALIESDWFLAALSINAIKSGWVQAKVHWALDNRKDSFVEVQLRLLAFRVVHGVMVKHAPDSMKNRHGVELESAKRLPPKQPGQQWNVRRNVICQRMNRHQAGGFGKQIPVLYGMRDTLFAAAGMPPNERTRQ